MIKAASIQAWAPGLGFGLRCVCGIWALPLGSIVGVARTVVLVVILSAGKDRDFGTRRQSASQPNRA
jgi:hypothetical protein